jgi:hypothetical protein
VATFSKERSDNEIAEYDGTGSSVKSRLRRRDDRPFVAHRFVTLDVTDLLRSAHRRGWTRSSAA